MPLEIPTTAQGQLTALFAALGVTGFEAAATAVTTLKESEKNFNANQKAFFDLVGAKDHETALSAFASLQSDRGALFKALGDSTDVAGAMRVITSMQDDRNAIWKALGGTDHASALANVATLNGRVTTAEGAQKDFDARLEKGITEGVIARAAAAGLPAPIAKTVEGAPKAGESGERAVTPRRRLGQLFQEQITSK